MREFDIIVAAEESLGIARDGDLPWHLPGDLKHYKQTTTHTDDPDKVNAVFMGRKTWESIPDKYRPLSGRLNAVITRQTDYRVPDGVMVDGSIAAVLEQLEEGPEAPRVERVFCVGGGGIYAQAVELPECKRIIITRIRASYDCDTFFPQFEHLYELSGSMGGGEDNGVAWDVEVWRRRA